MLKCACRGSHHYTDSMPLQVRALSHCCRHGFSHTDDTYPNANSTSRKIKFQHNWKLSSHWDFCHFQLLLNLDSIVNRPRGRCKIYVPRTSGHVNNQCNQLSVLPYVLYNGRLGETTPVGKTHVFMVWWYKTHVQGVFLIKAVDEIDKIRKIILRVDFYIFKIGP